jgi:hypothetical protein
MGTEPIPRRRLKRRTIARTGACLALAPEGVAAFGTRPQRTLRPDQECATIAGASTGTGKGPRTNVKCDKMVLR